jgi:hypothetical protein
MLKRSRLGMLLAASFCVSIAGCVTQSVSGAGVDFHYERWIPVGIFVAGLACVPIALAVKKQSGRFSWRWGLIGPIAALAFAPSMYLEHVFVHDGGFEMRSGIWGMTAKEDVAFDAVRSCRLTHEETGGRRSRTIEVLYFDLENGTQVRVPMNNDVKIESGKEIVTRVAKRGIPITTR